MGFESLQGHHHCWRLIAGIVRSGLTTSPFAGSQASAIEVRRGPDEDRTMSDFKKNDNVSWNTSQGPTHGTVQEKRVKDFEFDGQHFTASTDEPAYIVKSEKTGAKAAHKGSALTRR